MGSSFSAGSGLQTENPLHGMEGLPHYRQRQAGLSVQNPPLPERVRAS